jgi:YggT family protein
MGILVNIVDILVIILTIAIFARVIVSWIVVGGSGGQNSIVVFIYQITEPILAPIRKIMPRTGAIDLSPMVALLLLYAIQWLIRRAAV